MTLKKLQKISNRELAALPETDSSKLRRLARIFPEIVIANPNCPIEFYMKHCGSYPAQAEVNPLLFLLSLDNPLKYSESMMEIESGWINVYRREYGSRVWVETIEHFVLPLWKASFPHDNRFSHGGYEQMLLPSYEKYYQDRSRFSIGCEMLWQWSEGKCLLSDNYLYEILHELEHSIGSYIKSCWVEIIKTILSWNFSDDDELCKSPFVDTLSYGASGLVYTLGYDIEKLSRMVHDGGTSALPKAWMQGDIVRFAASRMKYYFVREHPEYHGLLQDDVSGK